jgi:DNA helicase-2/ATP-dependent DNA helicase PcrA
MADSLLDLDSLNAAQREAVMCTKGPLLVLAGAGSGKTRVLTYRIAHMIADEGVRPWQVLAITFTNKAAAEMRERLGALLPGGTRGMWVCTFHAMCVRILREDAELLGYGPNFTIYDDDDSKRLVKRIMEDLDIEPKQYPINMIRSRISAAKNAMILPEEYQQRAQSPQEEKAGRVYFELQKRLMRANAMDFDDLLVNALELLRNHPDVLAKYQDRFIQISVDEYQDTNHVQYEITNLLAARNKNLMVVGDDDQSIYSWRGADLQNILDFEKDYPQAKVVKLEQNYRSTGHILNAANAVVAHNSRRKQKRLYTNCGTGEMIEAFQASDERDEGRWIAGEMDKLHAKGVSYDDMACFYRTNAQSRILEDMFLRGGVPYKIVGGTRFFDRAEIRDVMAYLKLVVNPQDDVSAQRIINVPRRGIGSTSVAKISAYAVAHNISFFEACQACVVEDGLLSAKVRNSLADFTSAIMEARRYEGELGNVVDMIVERSGLVKALQSEMTPEAEGRVENIHEFLLIAKEFDESHDDVAATLESLAELRAAGALDDDEAAEVLAGEADDALAQMQEVFAFEQADDGLGAPSEEEEASGFGAVASEKLPAFMEWLALRSDLDALAGQSSAVTMMTIHSAKGLEFPVVFVAGMEEGIFPHTMFDADPSKLEEERRLCYVAITRARQRLYLSYAATRRTYGSTQANPKSRFVDEIPPEDIHVTGVGSAGFSGTGWEKRGDRRGTYGSGQGSDMYGGKVFGSRTRSAGGGFKRPEPIEKDAAKAREEFKPGDRVSHKTFGPGVVLAASGDVIEVRFSKTGKTKKLMKGFAPIVKIEG